MHGEILQVEEWKCMYAPKPKVMQTCNLFDCPKWIAMEWSQVRLENMPLLIQSQTLMIICSVASTVLGNMVDAEVVCEHSPLAFLKLSPFPKGIMPKEKVTTFENFRKY